MNVNTGIYIQGGYNPATGTFGTVDNFKVLNNTISNVSWYHGIGVSEATNGTISGNSISNTADSGIALAPEATGGLESGIMLTNNSLSNVNTSGNAPGVYFANGVSNVQFTGNTVSSGKYTYAVQAEAGTTGISASGNTLTPGTSGISLDLGKGNTIQGAVVP